jgi:hypothetical protein
MSLQAVVPYDIEGNKFFTHTSWFSEKQHNAWVNIPVENRNLAFYYSLSTVSLIGIVNVRSLSFYAEVVRCSRFSRVTGRSLLGWGDPW